MRKTRTQRISRGHKNYKMKTSTKRKTKRIKEMGTNKQKREKEKGNEKAWGGRTERKTRTKGWFREVK